MMKLSDRILVLLSIFTLGTLAIYAQDKNSPFSMYGYGILGDRATSAQRQMGNVGYAMQSGRQINVMNPASYASIDSLTFLFDMGADITFLHSTEGKVSKNTVGGGLDYVTMQFPISKFMGMSIGMLPYTSVGYAFGNEIKHGSKTNQGSGGINEAYIGLGAKMGPISLGANFSYDFGNIKNDVYSFPSSGQSLFEHIMEVRDWNVNVGLQFTQRWNKSERITIGATYSPKKSMHGRTWVTIQDLNFDSRPDTLGYMKLKNNYEQPQSIGAGIAYSHDRNSHFMVEADFTYQDWSKARFSSIYDEKGQLLFEGMKFNNRYRMALGVEYTPHLRGGYFRKITYRLGGYFNRDYLNILGNRLNEIGVGAGFGLPTPEGKTIINIGFEYKRRYCTPHDLLSENYFNITVGINFNELWFWQRKIK